MPLPKEQVFKETILSVNPVAPTPLDLSDRILVDTREPREFIDIFESVAKRYGLMYGKHWNRGTCPVGDLKHRDVVIERKKLRDFLMSTITQHLDEQLYELALMPLPFLLISGRLQDLVEDMEGENRVINEVAIFGKIASIMIRYGVTVGWVEDDYQLSHVALKLFEKFDQGKAGKPNKLRIQVMNRDRRVDAIAQMLGIAQNQVQDLMKRFKTPRGIFSATEYELQLVTGIGPTTARKIKWFWEGNNNGKN